LREKKFSLFLYLYTTKPYKMGKFYEDLLTLNELVRKLEKKDKISEFIIRALRNMKENPTKSVSDVIKETKKEFN
jgi:hypothetical protein